MDHEAIVSSRDLIPQGDSINCGTFMGRKRDENGKLIGRSSDNQIHDTGVYEVYLIQDKWKSALLTSLLNISRDQTMWTQ